MIEKFINQLNWRYATKLFDSKKIVEPKVLQSILEATRLAPSSYGLQPWKFVVVSDAGIRKTLREKAWNQPQITDASDLIVLCSQAEMTAKDINSFADRIVKDRGIKTEDIEGYRQMMLGSLPMMQGEQGKQWMAHQVYIALGVLLSACAVAGVDACPMEGFEKEAFDKILNLEKYGIQSRVLCAVGYRAADDALASAAKVRFSSEEVVIRI